MTGGQISLQGYDLSPFKKLILTVLLFCSWQAYDQHLNMILSEVEETITTVEIDEETFEELFKVCICINRISFQQ